MRLMTLMIRLVIISAFLTETEGARRRSLNTSYVSLNAVKNSKNGRSSVTGNSMIGESYAAGLPTNDFNTSSSPATEFVEIISGPNLDELCNFLNISQDQCSCKVTHALCQFEEFINVVQNETEIELFHSQKPKLTTLIYASVTIIVSSFGLIGNGAVLFVAIMQRQHLPSCKLHIAELAFVSFIFSIIQIINVASLFITNVWIYGNVMCKVLRTSLEMGSLLIVGFILIISIERFFLIVRPLDSDFIEGILKHVLVAADIVFVLATVTPFFIGLRIEEKFGRCIQYQGRHGYLSLPYHWFVIVFHSFLPLCVMSALYAKIIHYISKQAKTIDRDHNYALYLKKMKRNKRVVYITMTILFFFLLCTLPTRVFLIYLNMKHLKSGNPDDKSDQSEEYWGLEMTNYFVIVFIGYLTYPFQSTINPILYSMVDTEWRKDLMEILRRLKLLRLFKSKSAAVQEGS